ncbi:unnamed protein product, partial [marine sediment metagenome]
DPSGISATTLWKLDFIGGDPTEASAIAEYYGSTRTQSWCIVNPADDEYWMRVTDRVGGNNPANYTISDGSSERSLGEAFQINEPPPYISVDTFGDIAPSQRNASFNVEICKDNGSGLPDGSWALRGVSLESVLNGSYEPPPTAGSVPWEAYFQLPLQFTNDYVYRFTPQSGAVIPVGGVSIRFTAPLTGEFAMVFNASADLVGM